MKTFLEVLKDQGVQKLFKLKCLTYTYMSGYKNYYYYFLNESDRLKQIEKDKKLFPDMIEAGEYTHELSQINVSDLDKVNYRILAFDKSNSQLSTDKYLYDRYLNGTYNNKELNWDITNIGYLELLEGDETH